MEFTKEERIAFTCAMYHVINADNKVDPREIQFFQKHSDITLEEIEEAKKMHELLMLNTLMVMSEPKRKLVGDIIKAMIVSDDKIHQTEWKVAVPILSVMQQPLK